MAGLERAPVVGQLLVGVNHVCRHYQAWQVALGAVGVQLLLARLKEILANELPIFVQLKKWIFSIARIIPFVRRQIESEVAKTRQGFEKSMIKVPPNWVANHSLPAQGLSHSELMDRVDAVV